MQTGSTPDRSIHWRSLAAKILSGLAGVAIIALAISFLVYSPPRLPEPHLYRIAPGVSGIRFYNANCGEQGSNQLYSYHFTKRDARCIFAEIHLHPNTPEAHGHAFFYDANGRVVGGSDLLLAREPSATIVAVYTGWSETGHWQPGIYRVEFIVEGELIAADEFQISDP
jgi:hypothetical protein